MNRWFLFFLILLLVSGCDSNKPNCFPSTGCVLLEEGDYAKSLPVSLTKDVCPNQKDVDWVVTYHLDSAAYRNADINNVRIYSDQKSARNKIGVKAQVNDPTFPRFNLCLSGRLSEDEAKSVWVWLKTKDEKSNTNTNRIVACVTAEALNIRSGPGKDFVSTGYLRKGDCIELFARNIEGTWAKAERGWVSTYYLSFEGDLNQLPVLDGQVSELPAKTIENIPGGFNPVILSTGVILYKKDYGGEKQDFVQIIDLSKGASLQLLHGEVDGAGDKPGMFGGVNPKIYREPLQGVWNELSASTPNAFCITNGQFFADKHADGTPIDPTELAFPVKNEDVVISEGYEKNIDLENILLLQIWNDRADITKLSQNAIYTTTAPNAIAGLTEDTNIRILKETGRTFLGISDKNLDGWYETILIFNSKKSTQPHAAEVLRGFGAEKIIMMDGGGSTQLVCKDQWYVQWATNPSMERTLPQFIAVVSGKPEESGEDSLLPGWFNEWVERITKDIEIAKKIIARLEELVRSIHEFFVSVIEIAREIHKVIEPFVKLCTSPAMIGLPIAGIILLVRKKGI